MAWLPRYFLPVLPVLPVSPVIPLLPHPPPRRRGPMGPSPEASSSPSSLSLSLDVGGPSLSRLERSRFWESRGFGPAWRRRLLMLSFAAVDANVIVCFPPGFIPSGSPRHCPSYPYGQTTTSITPKEGRTTIAAAAAAAAAAARREFWSEQGSSRARM